MAAQAGLCGTGSETLKTVFLALHLISCILLDSDVIATPKSKPQMNQTVVIVGAIVGTISILFVCGWLLYCFKKRQGESNSSSSNSRNPQGRSSNQQGLYKLVGTISILIVCGWLLYCFKKRQGERNSSSSNNRNPQGRSTNQQGLYICVSL